MASLTKEILAERLSKFYQELKQEGRKDYSRSAHEGLQPVGPCGHKGWIKPYLTSEKVGKTFSIIADPVFKTANKSLNAKLKKIKESGASKVKHHSSIQPEDTKMLR